MLLDQISKLFSALLFEIICFPCHTETFIYWYVLIQVDIQICLSLLTSLKLSACSCQIYPISIHIKANLPDCVLVMYISEPIVEYSRYRGLFFFFLKVWDFKMYKYSATIPHPS